MAGPDALAAKRVRHALRAASSKKRARAHIERVYANRLQETVAQGGTWKQAAQKLAEAEGKAVNDYPSVMPPSFMGLHDAQSLQHISEMYSFLTSRRKLKKGSQACRRRATSSRTRSSTLPPKAKASLWQTWAANRASNSFCLVAAKLFCSASLCPTASLSAALNFPIVFASDRNYGIAFFSDFSNSSLNLSAFFRKAAACFTKASCSSHPSIAKNENRSSLLWEAL